MLNFYFSTISPAESIYNDYTYSKREDALRKKLAENTSKWHEKQKDSSSTLAHKKCERTSGGRLEIDLSGRYSIQDICEKVTFKK